MRNWCQVGEGEYSPRSLTTVFPLSQVAGLSSLSWVKVKVARPELRPGGAVTRTDTSPGETRRRVPLEQVIDIVLQESQAWDSGLSSLSGLLNFNVVMLQVDARENFVSVPVTLWHHNNNSSGVTEYKYSDFHEYLQDSDLWQSF